MKKFLKPQLIFILIISVISCSQTNQIKKVESHEEWTLETLGLSNQADYRAILSTQTRRIDLAKLMFKVCELKYGNLNDKLYNDISELDDISIKEINALHDAEIMIGTNNNNFNPYEPHLTKSEFYNVLIKTSKYSQCQRMRKNHMFFNEFLGEYHLENRLNNSISLFWQNY